jgi:hypothetical protein
MPNINQYCIALCDLLADQLNVHQPIHPRPLGGVLVTNPDYAEALIATYGLSQPELYDCVFRIGVGRKLSKDDSDIYDEYGDLIERPTVDERGILCPQGILMFYEDVLYRKGRDVRILVASYHFQTAPQNDRHPLYVRFEFDPLIENPPRDFATKPIFHYHFSNYHQFHKRCHFPAGHFEVSDRYPFARKESQQHFAPPPVPKLESFLRLLAGAGLIKK